MIQDKYFRSKCLIGLILFIPEEIHYFRCICSAEFLRNYDAASSNFQGENDYKSNEMSEIE